MPDHAPAEESPPTRRTRRRRPLLLVILVTHVVLALVTALTVVLVYRSLDRNIAALPDVDHQAEVPQAEQGEQKPRNILVMGSDSRDGAGNDIDGQAGIGQRSDTTILLHLSADRKEAFGVSLPRDALVDRPTCRAEDGTRIPGEQLSMFNDAFALGGPKCTVEMVEALTGVFIDDYVVVDFRGFKDMVDAVHGVEVCLPKEVADPKHDIYFDAGTQTLTGQQALNYVRERTVLSLTGDIGRMKRQQAFIASMVNKVVSTDTLTRPGRVYDFLDAATRSIKLSKDLASLGKLVDLALEMRHTGLAKIKFITVPFEEYAPNPNRLVWRTDEADELWQRIIDDRGLGARFSESSINARTPVGSSDGASGGSTGASGGTGSSPGDGASTGSGDASSEQSREEALANGLCA